MSKGFTLAEQHMPFQVWMYPNEYNTKYTSIVPFDNNNTSYYFTVKENCWARVNYSTSTTHTPGSSGGSSYTTGNSYSYWQPLVKGCNYAIYSGSLNSITQYRYTIYPFQK